MLFTLKRISYEKKDNVILGNLYADDGFLCNTLENFEKSIPEGKYTINITYSEHFQRYLPELVVPRRTGIRIHAGNFAKDVSGCIAVGFLNKDEPRLYNSRIALAKVLDKLFGVFAINTSERMEIKIERD